MNVYKQLSKSNRFIGIEVLPFKLSNLIHNEEYSVSLKLDGERHLLLHEKNGSYLINRKMEFTKIDKQSLPENTIFDGELYNNKFYIFDTLFFNGVDTRVFNLQDRIKYYEDIQNSFLIPKKHHISTDLYNTSRDLINNKTFDIDGLIYTPINSPYIKTALPLKWKFNHTIDFKIKVIEYNPHYQKWELYAKGNILFKPFPVLTVPYNIAKNYFDNIVVEFIWNNKEETFIPLKIRFDKKDGNYIGVAMDNFNLSKKPINLSILKNIRVNSFFYNMRQFHNSIKKLLIDIYIKPNTTLLDLACGKGGDIFKWLGLKKVIGVDIDNNSLLQAKKRAKKFNVDFYKKDLSTELLQLNEKVDNIVCFFAIHYFFKTEDTLDIFFKNVSNNLKDGGYFIGTVFDGSKITKDMHAKNWSIKKGKVSNGYVGNEIIVQLKETVLSVPTKEYIVYLPFLVLSAAKYNLKIIKIIPFNKLYKLSKIKMNSSEKQFSFLNCGFIFKKY